MRSRYSNAGEIFIMTIVWAVVLFLLNKALTSTAQETMQTSRLTSPSIELTLRHVGCNKDRQTQAVQALSTLPWLGPLTFVSKPPKPADAHGESTQYAGEGMLRFCHARASALVQDVQQADFVKLFQVLRGVDIIPQRLDFGGLSSFTLIATVADLSCKSCRRAALDALTPLKVSVTYYATTNLGKIDPGRFTSFAWLASKSFDEDNDTITAKVHNQYNAQVDELIKALESAGLPPISVRIMTSKPAGKV